MTEGDNSFITEEQSEHELSQEKRGGLSIWPHLLIVGFILFLVFSTLIIPKALSFLKMNDEPAKETPVILPRAEAVISLNLDDTKLRAEAVHVLDVNSGATLYAKNANESLPLASITKLMTALVAHELVEDTAVIKVSRAAAKQESGGGLTWGEEFEAKELSAFALVSSFNAAAFALAASVGTALGEADGASQFVAAMNITAAELNLPSLSFYNPTGLDVSTKEAGGYGTASDVSALMKYLYVTYPEIIDPTTTPSLTLQNSAGAFHTSENTNGSLSKIPNLLGSKTGYTDLAGGNLTIIFDAGFNRPVVVTVLGSTLMGRFADVETLVAAVQVALSQE